MESSVSLDEREFWKYSSDSYTPDKLEEEVRLSLAKCAVLEQENTELRTALRKSINESVFGKEFESISIDRERMTNVIEQLKVEKSHLVESVLNLSGEVDEANRARQEDQTKFKQEVLRHGENEKALRASKYRMGMQVVELLKIRGVTSIITQELNAHIATSCTAPSLRQPLSTSMSTPSSSFFPSSMIDNLPSGENKASAGDMDADEASADGRGRGKGERSDYVGDGYSPTRSSSGRSRSRGKSPGGHRRRRSEVLDRDETDSIISSVSTHRSGASTSGAMSKGSTHHSRHNKAHSTPITAETLALLDKQNNDSRSGGGVTGAGGTQRAVPTPEAAPRVQAVERSWWGF